MTLVKECLSCNIFKWSGKYFSQIRGLAMGQRLAPVIAICFMSKIEAPVLARLPLMYCRYIDDCYIVTSTQSEMDECFSILNQQSEHISFTRETPRDGWLAFLNTQVNLSNNTIRVIWYRKASSKNILIHATSAHPSSVKRAIVRNLFRTASQVCSDDHQREESLRLASSITRENGYTLCRRRTPHSGYFHGLKGKKKLSLCLPFISDDISTEIRRCLARAQLQNDVTLVNIPNGNLKKQLVRNRLYDSEQCISNECVVCPYGKTGDCSKTGVIYQIKCLSCDALYIGETGRILSTRVKEHLASKRRRSLISALGRHRQDDHGGEDFDVACTILAQETEITARKTMEAFWISEEIVIAVKRLFICPCAHLTITLSIWNRQVKISFQNVEHLKESLLVRCQAMEYDPHIHNHKSWIVRIRRRLAYVRNGCAHRSVTT
ncbi:hypothetical protein Y032_0071g579 [Ancylostoma ceylanicum]|nr:hypothetical protein Y032_0071g579 [Ancylostoma ceylanicum]